MFFLSQIILFHFLFQLSNSLFFSSLGMGSSNCQCQTSCNSPPPQLGCFCAPKPCSPNFAHSFSPSTYPAFQPPQQFNQHQIYATLPTFPQGPPPQPAPPLLSSNSPQSQFINQPQQIPYKIPSNSYAQLPSSLQSIDNTSLQQIKLQPPSPPSALEHEYMKQLVKVLETSSQFPFNSNNRISSNHELPSSFYEKQSINIKEVNNFNENIDTYTDSLNEENINPRKEINKQPSFSTSQNNYIPIEPSKGRNEIRTTEIKIIQTPYEEDETKPEIDKNSSSFSENDNQVEAVWTPSSTSSSIQVKSSKYPIERNRGEGTVDENTVDISESGYEFTGISSSLPPVTLDYLSNQQLNEIKNENQNQQFTKDVNYYHKSSGSTIPLPTESSQPTKPVTSIPDFGYENFRDPRNAEENNENSSASEIEIYDDLVNKFPQKESLIREKKAENVLGHKDEKISKCNNAKLKEAMHLKMSLSPSISKQMIYSAASELFPGRSVNVICSKHSFSYIVVTSPVFCEHRKRPLTCFAFFQP